MVGSTERRATATACSAVRQPCSLHCDHAVACVAVPRDGSLGVAPRKHARRADLAAALLRLSPVVGIPLLWSRPLLAGAPHPAVPKPCEVSPSQQELGRGIHSVGWVVDLALVPRGHAPRLRVRDAELRPQGGEALGRRHVVRRLSPVCDHGAHGRAAALHHLPVEAPLWHQLFLEAGNVGAVGVDVVLHVLGRRPGVLDPRRVRHPLGHPLERHAVVEVPDPDRQRRVVDRLVRDHVPVDEPVGKRGVAVIKRVLSARVGRTAVALLDALAVHPVRAPAAGVVRRLRLVVVEPAALGRARRGAVKVARRHVVARVGRRPRVVLELDKPPGVRRVVELLPDRAVPVERLDRVSIDPHTRLLARDSRISRHHHLGLLGQELFRIHRMRVGPEVLAVGPVVHHQAVLDRLGHRVKARVVARVQHGAAPHVPRRGPGGEARVAVIWRRRRRPWVDALHRLLRAADRRVPPGDDVGAPRALDHICVGGVRQWRGLVAEQLVHKRPVAAVAVATRGVVRTAEQGKVEATSNTGNRGHDRGDGQRSEPTAILHRGVRRCASDVHRAAWGRDVVLPAAQ
eukprot:m.245165 g.245165  ORF g.245165 m.245165 type:complete len:572 (-) comp26395_c0_seq1:271-1986(-)